MFHVPRVIDHYEYLPDNIPEIIHIPSNECLICLELYADDKVTPIDWKTQKLYLKRCGCGGWVHICCVTRWYGVANTCPICRQFIAINVSNGLMFFSNMHNYNLSNMFIFVIYCIQIWNIFLWSIIATFCSYHIYSTYEEASQSNMLTDDNNDMFALDFRDPSL